MNSIKNSPPNHTLSPGRQAPERFRHINVNQRNNMKTHLWIMTLVAILCGGSGMWAADVEPPRADSKCGREEAQQLLKDWNDARPKAEAAAQKIRDAGRRPEALGLEKAKVLRDEQAVIAYDRYAKTAKEVETFINRQIGVGQQPPIMADIARFERLQAEVDLARIKGWLPAQEETETTLARQRARGIASRTNEA